MIKKMFVPKTRIDVLSLAGIVFDLNRLNGVWQDQADAIETIWSWLTANGDGGFVVSFCKPDSWGRLSQIERSDFPADWTHVGNHVSRAKEYWNWFYNSRRDPMDHLVLSDSPDFFGKIGKNNMWGDFGTCSASTFAMTLKGMRNHDIWVSVIGGGKWAEHVVLEAQYDCALTWEVTLGEIFGHPVDLDKPSRGHRGTSHTQGDRADGI